MHILFLYDAHMHVLCSAIASQQRPAHVFGEDLHHVGGDPKISSLLLQVWLQTFAPGVQTPIHRHSNEEILIVQRGVGKVYLKQASMFRFESPRL